MLNSRGRGSLGWSGLSSHTRCESLAACSTQRGVRRLFRGWSSLGRRRVDPGEPASAFSARPLCPAALGVFARCTDSRGNFVTLNGWCWRVMAWAVVRGDGPGAVVITRVRALDCQSRPAETLSEGLGGLEIDRKLIVGRLLEWQITHSFAAKHSIDIGRGAAVNLDAVGVVRDQSATSHHDAVVVDRREP